MPAYDQEMAAPRAPRHTGAVLLAAAGVAAALALLVVATTYLGRRTGGAQKRPQAIERVLPAPGGSMLRQERLGVHVLPAWHCTLTVDGVRIPPAQIEGVKELGECFFRAGRGKAVPKLRAGDHTATATVFPLADPANDSAYTWSFRVL